MYFVTVIRGVTAREYKRLVKAVSGKSYKDYVANIQVCVRGMTIQLQSLENQGLEPDLLVLGNHEGFRGPDSPGIKILLVEPNRLLLQIQRGARAGAPAIYELVNSVPHPLGIHVSGSGFMSKYWKAFYITDMGEGYPDTVVCYVLMGPTTVLGIGNLHLQRSSNKGTRHGVRVTNGGWFTGGTNSTSREKAVLLISGRPVMGRPMSHWEAGTAAATYTVASRCARAGSSAVYTAPDAAEVVEVACEAASRAVDKPTAGILSEHVVAAVCDALGRAELGPAEGASAEEAGSEEAGSEEEWEEEE